MTGTPRGGRPAPATACSRSAREFHAHGYLLFAAEAAAGRGQAVPAAPRPAGPGRQHLLADVLARCDALRTPALRTVQPAADQPGTAGRPAGRGRREQPGDRRSAVPVPTHGGEPPAARLRQARRERARSCARALRALPDRCRNRGREADG